MMVKKLGQYGGYLLSGILIVWSIDKEAAATFLQVFFKMTLLISIPLLGAYLLDKLILVKHQKAWNLILPVWILISIPFSIWLVKEIAWLNKY